MPVLAGCSGSVAVDDPTPAAADVATCSALLAALPPTVLDGERRPAEPGRHSAAWGDPAITLRCGVAQPAGLTAASACLEADGVGWFSEAATGGYRFTTIGRRTFVELAVPSAYAPESGALIDVAAAVRTADPLVRPCS